MYYTGQNLILRMDVEGVSLNGNVCIPSYHIQVGSESGKPYSPHADVFWVSAQVTDCSSGVLTCELSGHPGAVNSFFSQSVDPDVTKLILTGGAILDRLTGGHQPLPPQPKRNTRPSYNSSVHTPVKTAHSVHEQSSLREYPIRNYQKDYTCRFQDMKIVDGAALFSECFDIPYFQRVRLELRVENTFLVSDFEYIKPYLANRLGKHKVAVSAMIRTQGPKVIETLATASLVDEITPELIGRVRHWQIRRALRTVEGDQQLVTVDQLFKDGAIEKSNITPTDVEFVEDILAIRNPKHGDHIRYLSARHVHTIMRLRWVKKIHSFLFLIAGKQSCFLVLETLNSKEATYLWRLNATAAELDKNRDLFRQKFEWVEQEISIICTEGRDAYKDDPPEDFDWVRHEYEKEDGFGTWKDRLHQVLDEDNPYCM